MHKPKKKIPESAIPRLSLYYRALPEAKNPHVISSEELASLTGVTASQVRRDLTYFGQFGTPGKGYDKQKLSETISKILGTDKDWNVALVGTGNLGAAFLRFEGFREQGFNIKRAFDSDESKVGSTSGGVKIQNISELRTTLLESKINMAIVAVPVEAAPGVMDALVEAGVRAILNFSPYRPNVPEGIEVLNINLSIALEKLAYFLTKSEKTSDNVFFI